MRNPRPYLLLALAVLLGGVAAHALLLAPTTSNGIAALVALGVAVLAAAIGFVELVPRATTELTREAKVAAGILFAVGSIMALTLAVTGPPVAVGMALLPAPLYVWLALRIDRNEREPRPLLVTTFLWGACVAVAIGGVFNIVGESAVSSALGNTAGAVYGGSISAPIFEELSKGAVLLLLYRRFRGEFNGVLDGIVYATVVGLGFAMAENIEYYGDAWHGGVTDAITTFVARGVFTPFLHPLMTSMTGIGLGVASLSSKRRTRVGAPLLGLAAAMVLHSINNSASLLGGAGWIGCYVLVEVPVFVAVLIVIRRTLKRERRIIEEYLAFDVLAGRLTSAELAVLACGRGRRRALKETRRLAGRQGRRVRAAFHQAAAELAFLRERLAKGLVGWDAHTTAEHERYQVRLTELRGRLAALAVR
jgi:RsiW-degrading membrane proteinase PrsW (M82 family)